MSFCCQPCSFNFQARLRRSSRQSAFLGAPILLSYHTLLASAEISKCYGQQERSTVIRRAKEGKTFLFCDEDGTKIRLKQPERLVMSSESRALVDHDQALIKMRTSYETALSS